MCANNTRRVLRGGLEASARLTRPKSPAPVNPPEPEGVVPDAEYLALMLAHQRRIWWWAVRRVEWADPDDLTQDVLLALWKYRRKFDPSRVSRLSTWSPFAIWARTNFWWCVGEERRRRFGRSARLTLVGSGEWRFDRARPAEVTFAEVESHRLDGLTSPRVAPPEACQSAEAAAAARASLARLTEDMREVVAAKLTGEPLTEIAAARGVSKQAVSDQYRRASEKLRWELARFDS
jgi:RNA polymerase sigma factor (sigma-70 family)